MYVCAHVCAGILKDQNWTSDPLELESWAVVSIWHRCSELNLGLLEEQTTSALNLCTISSATEINLNERLQQKGKTPAMYRLLEEQPPHSSFTDVLWRSTCLLSREGCLQTHSHPQAPKKTAFGFWRWFKHYIIYLGLMLQHSPRNASVIC